MRARLRAHSLALCVFWLTATLSSPLFAAQFPAPNAQAACARPSLKGAATVGGFAFATYRNDQSGLACFQVVRNGKVIFRRTNNNDGDYLIGQHPSPDLDWNVPDIPDGTDITGLNHPDLVVYSYTGGAHCCLLAWVFELAPQFRILATLDAEDSWPAYFADLDHSGHYYFKSEDWTFAYWPQSFAGSPVAPIILKFVRDGKGGGVFHLAVDKMRNPPPTPEEWKKSLVATRKTFADGAWPLSIGSTLWTTEMQLIYSGHSDLAWKFLKQAWPEAVPGKQKWLGDFCSRLKTSPYWPDLQRTLQDMPAACVAAKP